MEGKTIPIFKKNTAQINRNIANILSGCSILVIIMVALSAEGFFEFGNNYNFILLTLGLMLCFTPRILIKYLPDKFMKYYMLLSVAFFIGILGANKNVGIYITYALVPIMSCFYFEPPLVLRASALSYVIMIVSVYASSADMAEVLYQGRPRMQIFLAYAAGFTIEYCIVTVVLFNLVRRMKYLMLQYNSAENALSDSEKERQMMEALCINYSAAYYCDLMKDYMEPVKQNRKSHAMRAKGKLKNPGSYSEWIQYTFNKLVIKKETPDYLKVFNADCLMRYLQKQESFVYRHRTIPNEAGLEYFETTVVRLYTDENSFKVIMGYRPIDDIVAEEKEHQYQMEQALNAARQAAEAKTNFLHRMSHDIRTPLNGIIGLLKIDKAHFDDTTLVWENHEKMETAANHLLSLINDVLQMGKIEDGSLTMPREKISLFDLTRDIVDIVSARVLEAGLIWEYKNEKTEIPYPYIYGSALHLRQVFLNIYGNCIKYNRPGGKITTTVDSLGDRDGICTYRWIISDTGIGMSQEFVKHIFEPFVQEKNDARSSYQGTGLGMAIVKNLVELMGGTISVSSEEGAGSEFVITIPFEIASHPLKETDDAVTDKFSIQGMSLLLAEDNELNAEIAKTLLSDSGANVTVVSDGKQAVEKFKNSKNGKFQAILMDVMMPVMDGLAATKAIRSLKRSDAKKIPIIAMTANAFEEDIQRCLEAGMNAHLAKPLQVDKMIETIASQGDT